MLGFETQPRLLAIFPYTAEARSYISSNNFDLDAILTNPLFERVREKGKERVLSSLRDMKLGEQKLYNSEECKVELLSFIVSRMMASVIGDRFLINRLAVTEGKAAEERLNGEYSSMLVPLAREFGIDPQPFGDAYRLKFTAFLKYSSKMRSPEWKLLYQKMDHGYVVVEKHRLTRLVEQAITDYLSERLPPYTDAIRNSLRREIAEVTEALESIKKEYQRDTLGEIEPARYPPCMREILRQIQNSENVPQMGRFAIVTFLHAIGMTPEQIFEVFSSVPDFRAEKTRYQIEHITGKISSTEYSVPECSTMKSYGICYNPDTLCAQPWMKHPLTYYKQKGKKTRAASRKQPPDKQQ